jgi:hypothetical protein
VLVHKRLDNRFQLGLVEADHKDINSLFLFLYRHFFGCLDGKRTETRNIGLRMENYQGTWTPISAGVYGEKLPEDLKMEFTLTPQ